MILALPLMLGLAQTCAPFVAPETLLAVARVESAFDPLALAVNGARRQVFHPATAEAAIATARSLIAAGRSVDLGLGQINSRNLAPLGLSVEGAFDPCRNLAASAELLRARYLRAVPVAADQQAGLRVALSFYNTGDASRGFRNGYVERVTRAAGGVVPPLRSAPSRAAAPSAPARPAWDVFARPVRRDIQVF